MLKKATLFFSQNRGFWLRIRQQISLLLIFNPYFSMFEALVAMGVSVLALVYAAFLVMWVVRKPTGNAQMQSIALSIQEGAKAYLNRQSLTMGFFAVAIFVVLYIVIPQGAYNNNLWMAVSFIVGALFSALAGYIGMNVSVRANVRTAEGARKGIKEALSVAFNGGAVTGLSVVGLDRKSTRLNSSH